MLKTLEEEKRQKISQKLFFANKIEEEKGMRFEPCVSSSEVVP